MKSFLVQIFWVLLFASGAEGSEYRAVAEAKFNFLQERTRPLFLTEVTRRLGRTEIGRNGPFYAYTTAGGEKTVEFWMFPPPEKVTAKTVQVEIAMVVERSVAAKPVIIWPRELKGSNIDAAKKKFWPRMY